MLRHLIILFTLSVCVKSQLLNKEEGSKCEWKGLNGTCVLIYKCQSAIDSLKKRDYAPICSFKGREPIICCPDCKSVEDIRKMIFNPHAGMLLLDGQKAHDQCIKYIDTLDYHCKTNQTSEIVRSLNPKKNCYVYGENRTGFLKNWEDPTPMANIPYMALLGYGEDMKNAQWLCAGGILSEKFIITAAHCLSVNELPVKFVAFGVVKRTDSDNWQKRSVKKATAHPEYQPPSMYHDIALIETETTISFSKNVLPGCMYSQNYGTSETYTVVWDSADTQETLTLTSLEYMHDEQCAILFPPQDKLADGFNETSQLCWGNTEQPTDSCQGYSGGPIISTAHEANCAPFIIGVSSIDRNCGTAGSSGLYTALYPHKSWIENIIWP